ncbi:DUF5681 domain-containing protein [Rhodoferax sp.]|uniref:DUF5681 domain-containing protein n=1 Tax=Rhodoferax sp. TaxID=50421 RepID=UPI00260BC2CA|nr:DUF5681 domain-containing protein [Rhodoferax sp.]MDD2809445.1 DUF5681 domain-containing protein [Rhodoferax sp.]
MTTIKKRASGNPNWKPGKSGNPKGRTPGTCDVPKLRAAIAARVPEILNKLLELALEGDTGAARLLLERAIAPLKSIEPTQPITLPDGSLTDQGRAVLTAVAAGALAPGQGSQLIAAIGALARVAEIDELEKRMTALENQHGNT